MVTKVQIPLAESEEGDEELIKDDYEQDFKQEEVNHLDYVEIVRF